MATPTALGHRFALQCGSFLFLSFWCYGAQSRDLILHFKDLFALVNNLYGGRPRGKVQPQLRVHICSRWATADTLVVSASLPHSSLFLFPRVILMPFSSCLHCRLTSFDSLLIVLFLLMPSHPNVGPKRDGQAGGYSSAVGSGAPDLRQPL